MQPAAFYPKEIGWFYKVPSTQEVILSLAGVACLICLVQ